MKECSIDSRPVNYESASDDCSVFIVHFKIVKNDLVFVRCDTERFHDSVVCNCMPLGH